MANVRNPAVAGLFYTDDARELRAQLKQFLALAEPSAASVPKAIIAPHAGYIYSGPIAGSVYALVQPARDRIRRVVLLGPAHRVGFSGLAAPSVAAFNTPLGPVGIDREALQTIAELPGVLESDQAHAQEHSLEVHLPFLQAVLERFTVVPLVVGDAPAEQVGAVLEALWGGPETLIVISSDLSHYQDYASARRRDAQTSRAIVDLQYEALDQGDACGRNPISGLLWLARKKGLRGEIVDLRNSGDTAGPHDQVVGYGAYAFR